MSSRALPLVVGIGLVVTAAAQAVTIARHEPEPPVLLRLQPDEGESVSYRMEMEMDGRVSAGLVGQPFEVAMVIEQDWLVDEVAPDGSVTIEIDTSIVEATTPQGPIPEAELESVQGPSTMRLAADGTVLEASLGVTGGITGPASIPGLEGFGPTFPEDPVAPGDTWDLGFDMPLLPGGDSLTVTGRGALDGYEEVGGIRSAVIVTEGHMPLDFELDLEELAEELGPEAGLPEGELEGRIVYEGEMTVISRQWVDPATGLQVRSEGGGAAEISFSLPAFPQNGEAPAVPTTRMEFDVEITLERR